MKLANWIFIFMLVLVFGCGPKIIEGRKIDGTKIGEIIKGKTTAEKVVELFGKPEKIEKLPGGGEKYMYRYSQDEYTHWWTLPRLETQQLTVVFKDGIAQDYQYENQIRDEITAKENLNKLQDTLKGK